MNERNTLTSACLTTLIAAGAAAGEQYELTIICEGPAWCTAYGLMEDGTAVGQLGLSGSTSDAIWWADGGAKLMPDLGGLTGWAADGASGVIAGVAETPAGAYLAVVWTDDGETLTVLPKAPDRPHTQANGIAPTRDAVVGFAHHDNGGQIAMLWNLDDGVWSYTVLPGGSGATSVASEINADGVVAGWVNDGLDRAAIWTDGALTMLGTLDGDRSWAWGISDAGHVVGTYRNGSVFRAFVHADDVMEPLPHVAAFVNTKSQAVNKDGLVVGWAHDDGNGGWGFDPTHRAVIWRDDQVLLLDDLVDLPAGGHLLQAWAILDNGTITGRGWFGGGFHGFVLTPILTGDVNGDGVVGFADLVELLAAWGPCIGDCPADLNDDGFVNFTDLVLMLGNWS